MDLDEVADELYGLPPKEFTAARDQRAAQARQAGERTLAHEIRALRRPTAAAWAGNLLARHRPEEARALTALGDGLRRAHRELDGERLRELTRRQRSLVATLALQARQLAAERGQPISEAAQQEVEATLQAVLADPEAAREWTAGRLTKPFTAPAGFPALATAAVRHLPAARERHPAGEEGHKAVAPVSNLDAARARRQKRERDQQLARHRRELREAQDEHRAREDDLARVQRESARAQAAVTRAEEEVEALEQELKAARSRHLAAKESVQQARIRERDAERAAQKAARRAEAAASDSRKPDDSPSG
ncbi:hypothetical protein [Streptomyces hiroshimensis]|uniref:Transposase n=1 Tax=Streptomyces hiroshimensis TaxID=66424 RepID=A0ABQ2Y8R2_9ACTN|nr:hypothetical protein [Streptomyces hiroshimensis]GGX73668.1 hypothetical protein GCM10010324_18690 [Streptomyces hiroshimensis]